MDLHIYEVLNKQKKQSKEKIHQIPEIERVLFREKGVVWET